MTERSRFWDGTSTGDATDAPYDFGTEVAEVLSALTGAEALANKGGVFRGVSTFHGIAMNLLACTGSASPVSVNTGLALCYGGWYWNDAAVPIAIPTPSGATRVDRIVLRKSWGSTQTIRLTRIAGVEGAGAPALGAGTPAYTQTFGTTWDLPLFQISITTGGVITITDERVYLPYHGNQSAEGGTEHAYSQISGTPSMSGTVTTIVPGAAGTAGVSSSPSAGDHQHPLASDPQVTSGSTYTNPSNVQANIPGVSIALLSGATYRFSGLIPCVGGSNGIGAGVAYSSTYSSLFCALTGPNPSNVAGESIIVFATYYQFGTDSSFVWIEGWITTTGAGNLTLQVAGLGAGVGAVGAGCMLHARRLY